MNAPVGSWIAQVEKEVQKHLEAENSGHDRWHAFRVRDLGIRIAGEIGAEIDVVAAAALLHDIGHATGRTDHAHTGARLARSILLACSFPAGKVEAVIECIEQHEWQPGRVSDPRHPTLEYQAFADADRLDALGAIGIARTFAFGGAHGRPLWDPAPGPTGPYGRSSIHHFYDKLLKLPADMYTEPGRRLAVLRVAVLEEFLRTFYAEWEGIDANATGERDKLLAFTALAPEGSGKDPRSRPSDLRLDLSA